MAEEPTLPSLSIRIAPTDESRSQKRVKLRNTSSPPISSDPPFFSSDDDPSAENYSASHGRNKRKFRGPWYSQRPAESDDRKVKRTLQRQLDSGIWLGSDGTESDADAEFSSHVQLPDSVTHNQQFRSTRPAASQLRKALKSHGEPSPEELAEKEIELCLEAGKEDIDMSYVHWMYNLNATLTVLQVSRTDPSLQFYHKATCDHCFNTNEQPRNVISSFETKVEALFVFKFVKASPGRDLQLGQCYCFESAQQSPSGSTLSHWKIATPR